jgi:hypothetical protein
MKKLKKEMMGKLANGDDPMEPWSKKHNAPLEEQSEQKLLIAYIRSLGYAPEFMTSSQKSAYARSKGFEQYKVSHDFSAKNEAYVRKTAAQKIAAAVQRQREKNKPYEAHQERMRQLDALMKGMKTEEEEINEAGTGLLMTFIRAKGLDPLTMHGNQKASYSRSSEFRLFKRKHRPVKETSGMGERGDDWNEETVKEEIDETDTVVLDIPLLIRLLELAREDIKTDADLHRVVERLIDIRKKGTLTMDDYNFVAGLKEEFQIDEMKKAPDNMDADTIGVAREDSVCWTGYKRKPGTKKFAPGSCVKEEPVVEKKIMSKKDDPCWTGYRMYGKKNKNGKEVPNCVPEETVSEANGGRQYKVKSIGYHPKKGDYYISPRSGEPVYKSGVQIGDHENPKTGEIKKKVNEDKYQDPQAATQTVGMEVEGKSRAFKAIKKLTKVNETTYDWEKTEKDNNSDKKQMTAKIIMKGGKTMTGQDRDTIQIDPIVRTKLDAYKSVNPNNNK